MAIVHGTCSRCGTYGLWDLATLAAYAAETSQADPARRKHALTGIAQALRCHAELCPRAPRAEGKVEALP